MSRRSEGLSKSEERWSDINPWGRPRMKRTAVYARFSSELQQERSIDDHFAVCRNYVAKSDLEVIATYSDRARSG